jgi:hypothetical protein
MSLHVFSSLRIPECATAVRRAVPLAQIESKDHNIVVTMGRHRVKLILEEWGPLKISDSAIQTKVNIYSVEPDERERSLEATMNEEMRLGEAVRAVIESLQSVETWSGDGIIIPPEAH